MADLSTPPLVFDVLSAPITVLVGHFGAGKTEIAVNLALGWRERGEAVSIVDLDLVKPYFRTRLLREEFAARGIDLVVPPDDRLYADLPILVPEVRGAVGRAAAGGRRVIMDVGGADVGARVLGAVGGLTDSRLADVLFIVNGNRPFAETAADVIRVVREVEAASRLSVTGLVANTHLMDETTPAVVEAGLALAEEVGAELGVPVRFWVALDRLVGDADASPDGRGLPVLAVKRRITPPLEWRARGAHRRTAVV
ncbi:MAG: cobalamin biosynthesis protein CbiA [Acidobacteriota bacterium]